MQKEGCGNCKHGELVWIHIGETRGGVHSSDKHIDMYRMTLIKVFFPERRIRFELGLLYIYF